MQYSRWFIALVLSASIAMAQKASASSAAESNIGALATLPITFAQTISANSSHPGDKFSARTSQIVHLTNGLTIPAGTEITGHVTVAAPFVYDKTPYAQQKRAVLGFRFDDIKVAGKMLPLDVSVRAMADPLASWGAREPESSDLDPDGTVTQIGGDRLTPSRSEVVNMDGDVVAYNKRGGVYAHLIANARCDANDIEVSVDIYSASACGLYGFTNVSALQLGSIAVPSTVTLVSSRTSPKVWKHSTALLEVLPSRQSLAAR